MEIDELRTPAFLVDVKKVRRNARAMIERARRHGVRLRPHVKTHKTVEIARMQVGGGPAAITVSTPEEARFFATAGFEDITYAFPLAPDRLSWAAGFTETIRHFHVIVDHPEMAPALDSAGRSRGIRFSVFLKVDPGYGRAGVDPQNPASLETARRLHDSRAVDFKGILTHGGHAYRCAGPGEIVEAAKRERDVMVRFAGLIRENGIPCPEVSVGSTPTAVLGEGWEGVTEIRPGNYVFFDKFQADIGACRLDDCAASVLATVAGVYPERNRLLVNAGALSLSCDRGAEHLRDEAEYGCVIGHPDLKITHLSQEHGLVTADGPLRFENDLLGSRFRIIPNHSCLAAALFSEYYVVENGEVVDRWMPVRGR